MQLKVITCDAGLAEVCRELVSASGYAGWAVSTTDRLQELGEADLYLWDFEPAMSIPVRERYGDGHMFLVAPGDLSTFRARVADPDAQVLLKPVVRSLLAAFLGSACSSGLEPRSWKHSARTPENDMLQTLIQTNLRLQQSDQYRANFLLRVVYDFRAPLTALTGYCGLLLSEATGELGQAQAEVIRRMQHSAVRLSRVAEAVSELGATSAGPSPDLQNGDIEQCIERAVREIQPFASEKRIVVGIDVDPADEPLLFASNLVEQLLVHLLDNACKFSPKRTSIKIRGYPYYLAPAAEAGAAPSVSEQPRRLDGQVNCFRLDVCDSGSRIPEDELSKIFDENAAYGGKNDRSGGGLGLAICRMIVKQHGGHIWAWNTAAGPTFSFTLPIRTGIHIGSGRRQTAQSYGGRLASQ